MKNLKERKLKLLFELRILVKTQVEGITRGTCIGIVDIIIQ